MVKSSFKHSQERGNVILTAIFISIFLFFLSVALLVANKQDIVLSLSMEHKLKAEMAARSVAFEAYGHLREHGKLVGPLGLPLEDDVTTKVELVERPAVDRRGKLLEVRARATSGPFSSYLTLILQPTELATEDGAGDSKVMFLPRSEESALAIYGNFELVDLDQELPTGLFANQGPVFTTSPVSTSSRPAFEDSLPVFAEDGSLQGVGPVLVLGPAAPEGKETGLQWLEHKNGSFEWRDIPPPGSLADKPVAAPADRLVYDLAASGDQWTHASIQGVDGELKGWTWTDASPPTLTVEDTGGTLAASEPVQASPLSTHSPGSRQQYFTTRGTLAANSESVYTHGWHYLYQPYRGGPLEQVTPLDGSRLTRWPCVLKYSTTDVAWSVAWTPLQDDGSVESVFVPDPNSLWVTSAGVVHSLTSSGERRLLTLEATGKVEVSDTELGDGQVFFYRDQPHILRPEPRTIVNLSDNSVIGFGSLPSGIPGYSGTMLYIPQFQSKKYDEIGTNDVTPEGAWKIDGYQTRTVLPNFTLSYSFAPGRPITDGRDLYLPLEVSVQGIDSLHELFDPEYVSENTPEGGQAMARFDGERWHILPNGLRAFLNRSRHQGIVLEADPTAPVSPGEEGGPPPGEGLDVPPGMADAVLATYSGLPAVMPRYSVISIGTDPFEMSHDL